MTPAHRKAISLGRAKAKLIREKRMKMAELWKTRTCQLCGIKSSTLDKHQIHMKEHEDIDFTRKNTYGQVESSTNATNIPTGVASYSKDEHIRKLEFEVANLQKQVTDFKTRDRLWALQMVNDISNRFM